MICEDRATDCEKGQYELSGDPILDLRRCGDASEQIA
jgi:hypothetical protein